MAGEDIPLLARIITVSDTYDVILSSRPYRAAGTHEKALEELIKYSGKQFDPAIVEAFVYAEKEYSRMFGNSEKFHPGKPSSLYGDYNAAKNA